MQHDPRVVTRHWLNAARVDLDVAIEVAERFPQVASFHAQQAAEKALKAVIVALAGDAPRSHLIDSLLTELSALQASVPEEIQAAARSLEKHYIPTRYPDALGGGDPAKSYTVHDAKMTRDAALLVLDWAERVIHMDIE